MNLTVIQVRELVRVWLTQQGVDLAAVDWEETILIDAGYFCGARYSAGAVTAQWRVKDNLVLINVNGEEAPVETLVVEESPTGCQLRERPRPREAA